MLLLLLLLGVGAVAVAAAPKGKGGPKVPGGLMVTPETPISRDVFQTKTFVTMLTPLPNLPPWDPSSSAAPQPAAIVEGSSPTGARWLFLPPALPGTHLHPGFAYDANGEFWILQFPWTGRIVPTDGGDLVAVVNEIVTKYVVPAAAIMAGALIPGVGGIAVAAALTAWQRLASGGKLNDVLIDTAKERLPSLLAGTEFDRALALGRAAKSAIELAKAKAGLVSPNQRTAFDQGLVFAAAEKAQESAISSLKASLPAYAARIDEAVRRGAAVEDIAYVYGGDPGVAFVQSIFEGTAKGLPPAVRSK